MSVKEKKNTHTRGCGREGGGLKVWRFINKSTRNAEIVMVII